jgi:hypothetical protein
MASANRRLRNMEKDAMLHQCEGVFLMLSISGVVRDSAPSKCRIGRRSSVANGRCQVTIWLAPCDLCHEVLEEAIASSKVLA